MSRPISDPKDAYGSMPPRAASPSSSSSRPRPRTAGGSEGPVESYEAVGGSLRGQYIGDGGVFDDVRELLLRSYREEAAVIAPQASASSFEAPPALLQEVKRWGLEGTEPAPALDHILPVPDAEDAWAVKPLYALPTPGDGDCLLHGTSLGLFGCEDMRSALREVLLLSLTWGSDSLSRQLESLWIASERVEDARMGFPDARTPEQIHKDLLRCIDEASKPGSSLGAFHVTVLANILCRPIVVYAEPVIVDKSGDVISEQSLRGIYLPVCREPRACHRRCLLLLHTTRAASAGGHFTAIVGPPSGGGTDSSSSSSGGGGIPKRSLVPLCDRSGRLLPLKYAFFDEKQGMKLMEDEVEQESLITKYIEIVDVSITPDSDLLENNRSASPRGTNYNSSSTSSQFSGGKSGFFAIQCNIEIKKNDTTAESLLPTYRYAPSCDTALSRLFTMCKSRVEAEEARCLARLKSIQASKSVLLGLNAAQPSAVASNGVYSSGRDDSIINSSSISNSNSISSRDVGAGAKDVDASSVRSVRPIHTTLYVTETDAKESSRGTYSSSGTSSGRNYKSSSEAKSYDNPILRASSSNTISSSSVGGTTTTATSSYLLGSPSRGTAASPSNHTTRSPAIYKSLGLADRGSYSSSSRSSSGGSSAVYDRTSGISSRPSFYSSYFTNAAATAATDSTSTTYTSGSNSGSSGNGSRSASSSRGIGSSASGSIRDRPDRPSTTDRGYRL